MVVKTYTLGQTWPFWRINPRASDFEKNENMEAIAALKDAVHCHPNEKEGYFDLARAFLKHGNKEFCLNYLQEEISKDPTSQKDLPSNPLFKELWSVPRYKGLHT